MHVKSETLHHHKARKHHEDLPPGAGHELQRIIQPIAFAQNHGFVLRCGRLELRVKHHTGQGDGRGYSARNHIGCIKAQREPLPSHDDDPKCHEGGGRAHGQEPAQNLRCPCLRNPLQLQGLIDRFVIMKADRGEQCQR